MNLDQLKTAPRLLMEATLKPIQGTRFQPTGFPFLGAATYDGPDGTRMLLVESPQSMANHMEKWCWNSISNDWEDPLRGLPYFLVRDKNGDVLTTSVLEAHRINSEYIARTPEFLALFTKETGFDPKKPFDLRKHLVPFLLKRDVNSLIHGVFLEEIAGVLRLPRVLSGFIEAEGVSDAESGGVKINRIDATLKDGVGNLPYPKREFVARKITAFFNIDIAQIRGFGLSEDSQRLLLAIALYKVRRFLDVGLKLRSGCDLDLVELKVTRPADYAIPSTEQIAKELPGLIEVAGKSGLFASPSVTEIKWDGRAPGKKKGKTDKGELAGTEEETNS